MRALALGLALLAVPSLAHGLLPGEQTSRLTLGAEDPAKTFELPPLPSSAPTGLQPMIDPNLALHLRLLSMEIRLLNTMRPTIGAPLVLTLIGGTAVVVGGTSLLLGLTGAYAFVVIGLVGLMGGAAPLIIGGIWLIVAMTQNTAITKQIEKIEDEQRSLGVAPLSLSLGTAPTALPTVRVASF